MNLKGFLKRSSDHQLARLSFNRPPFEIRRHHAVEELPLSHCRAFWLNKGRKENGILIYLHGGGFVTGPVRLQWHYIASMSAKSDMAAAVIEYRKLPAHPFPQGLNDVMEAIEKIGQENPGTKWFLVGDSAGANLAMAASYKLRDNGRALPDKLVLMSPFLDASMSNPGIKHIESEDPLLSTELRFGKEDYAPMKEWENPLVSPMFGNLQGLSPILLQVGTSEIMLCDVRKFYKKCLEAGVEVECEEFPGMFHAFQLFGILPEARRAKAAQLKFLQGQ